MATASAAARSGRAGSTADGDAAASDCRRRHCIACAFGTAFRPARSCRSRLRLAREQRFARRRARQSPRAAPDRPLRRSACRRRDARRARALERAAVTPSATWPELREDLRQRARRAPARVRRGGCATGRRCRSSTRSPSPARPISVSRSPPSAADSRAGFGEAARDQRGARVVAEAQAVARAGRDGEHVLDRAARPPRRRGRRFRRRAARRRAAAPPATRANAASVAATDERRRQSPRDFLGEARPRDDAHRRGPPRRKHLMREPDARGQRRRGDEALRQPDERRARAGRGEVVRERRQRRDGRRDDQQSLRRAAAARSDVTVERVRQRDARQVARVPRARREQRARVLRRASTA